jgi:hypothetical protein
MSQKGAYEGKQEAMTEHQLDLADAAELLKIAPECGASLMRPCALYVWLPWASIPKRNAGEPRAMKSSRANNLWPNNHSRALVA